MGVSNPRDDHAELNRGYVSNPRDDRTEQILGVASVLLSTVIPREGNAHLQQNPRIRFVYYLHTQQLDITSDSGH